MLKAQELNFFEKLYFLSPHVLTPSHMDLM